MITAFPQAKIGERIKDIKAMLAEKADTFDTIDYVYIVDEDRILQGVISIKEIHSSKKDANTEDVMKRDLVVAHPLTHQERIVYLALSNKIKAIPVVDKNKRLLGIVSYDVILQIFNEEVRQDVFTFGGIFHKVGREYTTIKSPASVMIKTRIPWLIIGVLGGTITASIISSFENILSTLLALAAFAPVLAYLSDAVGTQSETLTVRSIALDPKLSLKSYFLRESIVALFLAFACGLMLSIVALIGWQNSVLGLVVGLSMFFSIIAAGPFATMVSDVATVTIYFGVASLLLKYFGLL